MKLIWRCPHCDFYTECAYDLDVAAQHAWEEHGEYCKFHINGEVIRPDLNSEWLNLLMRVLS